jgi:ribosomal protein S21
MTNKSREVEEQNKLREWKRHNHAETKETKEIATQAKKYFKWKGLRTIFSPFISY